MRNLVRSYFTLLFLLLVPGFLWSQSMWYSQGTARAFVDGSALLSIQGDVKLADDSKIINYGEVQISGSIDNESSQELFATDSGTLTLNGTSAQLLNGNFKFHNLRANNSAGIDQVSGVIQLSNTLYLQAGTLTSNDSFYLKSDSNRTAQVAETSGGTTTGNFIVERYVATGINHWRMISAPVQTTTLQDWVNDFYTSGFEGSPWPSFPFVSIAFYDETELGEFSAGYVNATNSAQTVNSGEGIWAYLGPLPLTFDAVGELKHGAQNFGVTNTDGGLGSDHDGWNLLGNPYASTIDWDAAGWTKTNINNAIYIWDGESGQFRTYVDGVGTNGGNSLIPSSQAFYVQTNASSPNLECTESVKSTTDAPFIYKPTEQQFIRFKLNFENYQDEAIVKFHPDATLGFDGNFDAGKTANQLTYSPSIFTESDSNTFSINSIPLENEIEIPIHFQANWNFTYDFSVSEIQNLPQNYCFQLVDLDSGRTYALDTNLHFQIALTTGITYHRFSLRGKKIFEIDSKDGLCFQDNKGLIEVALFKNDTLGYQLFSDEIQIRSGFASQSINLANLAAGIYQFKTYLENCSPLEAEIEIHEVDSLQIESISMPDSGNNSGQVQLIIQGGTPPYQTFWYEPLSTIGEELIDLWADTFHFYVIDANHCSKYDSVVIESAKTTSANSILENSISIFPNPSTSYVNVTGIDTKSSIRIISLDGKTVISKSTSTDTQIDIQHLNPGSYFIEIEAENYQTKKHFIKI